MWPRHHEARSRVLKVVNAFQNGNVLPNLVIHQLHVDLASSHVNFSQRLGAAVGNLLQLGVLTSILVSVNTRTMQSSPASQSFTLLLQFYTSVVKRLSQSLRFTFLCVIIRLLGDTRAKSNHGNLNGHQLPVYKMPAPRA